MLGTDQAKVVGGVDSLEEGVQEPARYPKDGIDPLGAEVFQEDVDGALDFFSQIFNAPKEVVAQSPALIAGSVGEIIETLQERRARWGFNYVVVQQNGGQGLEQFGEVIAALAGT